MGDPRSAARSSSTFLVELATSDSSPDSESKPETGGEKKTTLKNPLPRSKEVGDRLRFLEGDIGSRGPKRMLIYWG